MESINDIIQVCPLMLPSDSDSLLLGLHYLPYSTGFEIECDMKDVSVAMEASQYISGLIEKDVNSYEQRFRIPAGLEGLKALYNVSTFMKEYGLFNEGSGIHYHVDCTDVYGFFTKEFIANHSERILAELDTWEYEGTYNKRVCEFSSHRYWTRFKTSTQTMEFRIGEMTFDYELLFKRITHCNSIVKSLKEELLEDEDINVFKTYKSDYKDVVKSRIIKI